MLEIDHAARRDVDAPRERCVALAADLAGYPRWARLVRRLEGDVLYVGILGLETHMTCTLRPQPDGVVLERVPHGPDDRERFVATWRATPAGGRTVLELHVRASLDAPGPASLLRKRVERALVEDLLADFARAL